MNNCRVSLYQLGNSTKPNDWVDSWVINAFCRKLFKDKHPKHSDKHFFFHTSAEFFLEKWPNEYMKNIWQKNVIKNFLAADSAKKLHLSERLHFPALYEDHWFLFAVDIKTRNFLFLDSYYGQASKLHQQVDEKLISNFRKIWKDCKLKDLNFETFGKHYPKLPQQKTGNDCEVFIIKYMEKFCTRNPQSCSFSAKDIPDFRVRIAIDTFFNDHNSAIDQMDFISTFDMKSYKNDNAH
uniref:Uncharacterized protein n=1 Tax=Avena sativa TaxID=4498 RepID=A0ACD5X3T4_AVESA